jgi:putative ABC transport system permease protein
MSIWKLVIAEILHRKLNFGLGLLSVVVAIACLVGAFTLLRAHDLRTDRVIAAKELETQKQMAVMEDDYRKIMKELGFNVLILPGDQNLGDLYARGYASHYMPEEYAHRLAASDAMSVRHLLPSLQQKLEWPERGRTVILAGVRGEIPLLHYADKEPMLVAVPPGTMVLGYELHRSLQLAEGDRVEFLGRNFTVGRCNAERGTKDDITIWIDLREAQTLLGKEGQINGILALKCHCEGSSLDQLRREIARLLPETRVIEFASRLTTRAEARDRATRTARESIAAERAHRMRLRLEREELAAVLVPLVLLASALWIGFLSFTNVRERRAEIGILRALGLSTRPILSIFLLKALAMGVLGALAGYALGFVAGSSWDEISLADQPELFDPLILLISAISAPLLSCMASWLPAILASQQDPALALKEE